MHTSPSKIKFSILNNVFPFLIKAPAIWFSLTLSESRFGCSGWVGMSQQFLMKNSAFLNALFYSSTSRVAAQLLSHVQLFCDPMDCSTPSFPALQHLPEHVQTHVHSVSDAINHLVLCHPLLLLPSIFPSIRVFSNKLALRIRWLKY